MPMRRPSGSPCALALAHLVEADRFDGAAQRLRIVAGIEVALGDVVERHLLGPHQAPHAQIVGLDAELARQRIERHLQREAHAGAGNAAIGQDRRFVGGDRIDAAAVVREIVKARQDRADLAAFQAGRERIGGIGAGIDGRLAVERQQPAVGIGVGGEDVVMLAAIGVGGETLAPVLDPSQRDARPCASPRPAPPPRAAGCPCSRSRRRHRATMTRIWPSSMPRHSARPERTMCGCWVEVVTTSWPSREFQCATTPRPSIGLIACREVRSSRVTERAALALTASKFTSVEVVRKRLSPQCSCTSGAPGLRAASMSVTAGSGSKSTSISAHVLGLGPASGPRTSPPARRRSAPCRSPGSAARTI